MSELNVREIKLQLRYPESRQEDITDDYMRGYKSAVQVTDKLITRLNEENEKLRELVRVLYYCTTSGKCDECPVNDGGAVHLMPDTICDTMHGRMRELGVVADGQAQALH